MEIISPGQIKEASVLLRPIDPETGDQLTPVELLAKLGELGYSGCIVEPLDQTNEELLPYDPETDASLGSADYEEFVTFVRAQGSKQNLATQAWGRLARESGWRTTNNRFFEDSLLLRSLRESKVETYETDKHGLYEKSREDGADLDARGLELDALHEQHDLELTKLNAVILDVYFAIGDRPESERAAADFTLHNRRHSSVRYIQDTAARILDELRSPAEAGQPFVRKKQADGTLAPVYYKYDLKGRDLTDTVMEMDEAYCFLQQQLGNWPWSDINQRIPQLMIKFFNKKIQALQSSEIS